MVLQESGLIGLKRREMLETDNENLKGHHIVYPSKVTINSSFSPESYKRYKGI